MRIRAVILCCCHLFFALPLFARENPDRLVMKNGDQLTCEIKGLDNGVLHVSLPYAIETISVDWSEVAHLESKQLFLVKTENGSVYRGALSSKEGPAGQPIDIEVAETPDKKEV